MSRSKFDLAMRVAAGTDAKPLTPTQKLVYLILADLWNEDLGYAFPGVNLIAERAGLGRRGCQEVLRTLEAKGLIQRLAAFDQFGQRQNRYHVHLPTQRPEPSPPVSQRSSPGELEFVARMKLHARGERSEDRPGDEAAIPGPANHTAHKPETERTTEQEAETANEAAACPPPRLPSARPISAEHRNRLRYQYDQEKRTMAERLDSHNEQRGLRLATERLGAFDEWLAQAQGW